MNVIPSRINTRDPVFTANRVAMQTLVDNLRESFGTIAEGGGERPARVSAGGDAAPRDGRGDGGVRGAAALGQPAPRAEVLSYPHTFDQLNQEICKHQKCFLNTFYLAALL